LRNQKPCTEDERQKTSDGEMPVADLVLADPTDPKQRALRQEARGSRYGNRGAQPIAELTPGEEVLPLNSHWWWVCLRFPRIKAMRLLPERFWPPKLISPMTEPR